MELVNPVPVEEAEPWLAALFTTLLLAEPWADDFGRRVANQRRDWVPERTWGVRDRGRWVATLGTLARTVTIPGDGGDAIDLPADALTAVTVAATHRRRGLLRSMLTQAMQTAADRGDPLAVLVAAEWQIYGRYGYAPAVRSADYTLYPRRAGAVVAPDPSGVVRQVDAGELEGLAPAVFDRARRRWAGQIERPPHWWSRRLGRSGYESLAHNGATWIVHESEHGPDGLLGWKPTRDFDLDGGLAAIEVVELATASDRAYCNLWAYLCALDVIEEVALHARPLDEPVRWLLGDGRALKQGFTGDHTWLRLLDVPAALSGRGYGTPGQVVLEVVDPDGGWAAGRYRLDASPEGAACTRTSESADLVLAQRALAGAYLGDHSFRALSVAGGVDELTPGALARTDAMFATALRPWNATMF